MAGVARFETGLLRVLPLEVGRFMATHCAAG